MYGRQLGWENSNDDLMLLMKTNTTGEGEISMSHIGGLQGVRYGILPGKNIILPDNERTRAMVLLQNYSKGLYHEYHTSSVFSDPIQPAVAPDLGLGGGWVPTDGGFGLSGDGGSSADDDGDMFESFWQGDGGPKTKSEDFDTDENLYPDQFNPGHHSFKLRRKVWDRISNKNVNPQGYLLVDFVHTLNHSITLVGCHQGDQKWLLELNVNLAYPVRVMKIFETLQFSTQRSTWGDIVFFEKKVGEHVTDEKGWGHERWS